MFYTFLVLIHVLAAIIGVGASFIFPILMSAFQQFIAIKIYTWYHEKIGIIS